ncbi:uncharacterized protein LOC125670630 [Ostrea edulis]|uniref:uncharacterized protein LOC125670630 n=1 Tax=Ostrea edulis TaxID=37623 RepID=UPI0020959DC5|nr:uncharacterized protein LOC125670630 [Ostrea edulis]
MGVFQSCIARNNKIGVMKEEMEVYEKLRSEMVTEDIVEKKGGVAFGLTFIAEDTPKMPPPRITDNKKEEFEKWRETQEKTQALKQDRAHQNREEALTKRKIEGAHKEMERLEKYLNIGAEEF